MKKLLLPLFLLPFCSFAQTPVVQWMHTRGGSAGDYAKSVIQTADGGYLVGGSANSNDGDVTGNHGSADMWLQKFDADGIYQWQKVYGGSGSEWADSVIRTSDGGYAASGITFSNDGDAAGNAHWGAWIVKLTVDGTISWQKSYGTDGSGQAEARQLVQTADGGYIAAGFTQANGGDVTGFHGHYDFWIIKLNSEGNLVWQKALGGSGDDQAFSIQQTPDGGYITAGWTHSTDGDVTGLNGCYDGWVVKLSPDGAIEWEKAIGTNNCENIFDIKVTLDNGYIFVGNRGYDGLVVKTDAQGNVIWENQIGGGGQDEFQSVSLTSDGGYVISGFTYSEDGDLAGVPGEGKAWFVHLDANGEILWQRKLGGNGIMDIGYDIKEIAPGQYITCGFMYSDNGGDPNNDGENDMFIAKLVPESMGTENFNTLTATVYPNPASTTLHISLTDGVAPESVTVSDSAGRIIGTYSNSNIDVSGLANGVYFVNVSADGKSLNAKFIKQ